MLEGMFVAYLINIVEERDICPEALDLTVDLEKDWLKSDTEHKVVEGVTLVPTPTALDDCVTIDKFCLTSIQVLNIPRSFWEMLSHFLEAYLMISSLKCHFKVNLEWPLVLWRDLRILGSCS